MAQRLRISDAQRDRLIRDAFRFADKAAAQLNPIIVPILGQRLKKEGMTSDYRGMTSSNDLVTVTAYPGDQEIEIESKGEDMVHCTLVAIDGEIDANQILLFVATLAEIKVKAEKPGASVLLKKVDLLDRAVQPRPALKAVS